MILTHGANSIKRGGVPFPEGYTELPDGLLCQNNSGVGVGVSTNNSNTIIARIRPVTEFGLYLVTGYQGPDSRMFISASLGNASSTITACNQNNGSSRSVNIGDTSDYPNVDIVLHQNELKVYKGSDEYSISNVAYGQVDLTAFNLYHYSSNYKQFFFKELKVVDAGGSVIIDYISARRDSDSVVGFLDIVSGNYVTDYGLSTN